MTDPTDSPVRTLPPFVYAPVSEVDGIQRLSMDVLADGRTALFVYSAIDRLHDMYDADQAWAVATAETLAAAAVQAPYDALLLDTVRRPVAPPTPTSPPRPAARPAGPSGPPGIFLAGSTPVAPTSEDPR